MTLQFLSKKYILFLAACLFQVTAMPVCAQEASPSMTIGDVLAESLDESNSEWVYPILDQALLGREQEWKDVTAKERILINPRQVAVAALEKNLHVALSRENAMIASDAIQEAKAIFLPVFRVTSDFSSNTTRDRGQDVMLITKKFQPGAMPALPDYDSHGRPKVTTINWKTQTGGDLEVHKIFASEAGKDNVQQNATFGLGVTQQLPWGPTMDLGVSWGWNGNDYNEHGHKLKNPQQWTMDTVLSLTIPLPWTQGFGPNSSVELAQSIREKQSEQSVLNVKTTINTILWQAELAYWNLVGACEGLQAATESRTMAESQVKRVASLLEDGMATTYDKLQSESELASAMLMEEEALLAVLDSSYALAMLIDSDSSHAKSVLYIPGEDVQGTAELALEADEAQKLAMQNRPELQASQVAIETAELERNVSENNARPDIKLYASWNLDQEGSTVGYDNPLDAASNITDPDQITQNYAGVYNYPLFNRYYDAQYNKAEYALAESKLVQVGMQNSVNLEVGNALAALESARSRHTAATQSLEFAQVAYDRIASNRNMGEATEFEMNAALQRLTNAKLALVQVQLDLRKATSSLYAALGTVADELVKAQAELGDFEKHRIALLKAHGAVPFFENSMQ